MKPKYAKYIDAKVVRVRIDPIVVKSDVKAIYDRYRLQQLIGISIPVPTIIEPFPGVTNVQIFVITGKLIKGAAKGTLLFMAEQACTAKGRTPFVESTAHCLLWQRQFFTPLHLNRFVTVPKGSTSIQLHKLVLNAKKELLALVKGGIFFKPYKSI